MARMEEKQVKEELATEKTAKKKKSKILIGIVAAIICVVIAIVILFTLIIPNGKYTDALALMDEGKYTEAVALFKEISGYKDADQKVNQSLYLHATELQNNKKYEAAIEIFESVKNYKDSATKVIECRNAIRDNKYSKAVALMDEDNYSEALKIFEELDEYKESQENAITCMKIVAEQCVAKGDVDGAISLYAKYNDNAAVQKVKYDYVLTHKNNTDVKTYEYLKALRLDNYNDSADIYTELYSSVSVDLFFNVDFSDETTKMTTLNINEGYVSTNAYYHHKITGGYPGQVFKLKIVDEDRKIHDYDNMGWYAFEKGEEVKASDGVISHVMSVSIGNYYRITIYDIETGKQLACETLTVPNNY